MILSINPSYHCNLRCPHCYLGEGNLSDKTRLNLKKLDNILEHISQNVEITYVDLYGGEIGLIPVDYLDELYKVIRKYYGGIINVITNFTVINQFFYYDGIQISVSYDYIYREQDERVIYNILSFNKDIHILTLVIDELIENSDEDIPHMFKLFDGIKNIVSVEFKPYSTNQYNTQKSTYKDFEKYISKWLKLEGDYELVNRNLIRNVLNGTRTAYSDNHLYITPQGDMSVLDFDDNDKEFFLKIDNFDAYREWCKKEKEMIDNSPICSKCMFKGGCLSEHLKNVQDDGKGCNGFKNLLINY